MMNIIIINLLLLLLVVVVVVVVVVVWVVVVGILHAYKLRILHQDQYSDIFSCFSLVLAGLQHDNFNTLMKYR